MDYCVCMYGVWCVCVRAYVCGVCVWMCVCVCAYMCVMCVCVYVCVSVWSNNPTLCMMTLQQVVGSPMSLT